MTLAAFEVSALIRSNQVFVVTRSWNGVGRELAYILYLHNANVYVISDLSYLLFPIPSSMLSCKTCFRSLFRE